MSRVSRSWSHLRAIPGARGNVVAIVALAAVSLGCFVFIFGQYDAKAPWSDERTIAVEFEKAPSVRPESRQEVRIAGVTVGRIVAAEPMENGHAKVTMTVDEDVPVYTNASAVLRSKAPINVMYVALDPGSPPAAEMTENDMIPVSRTERLIQPWELLNKLDERTQSAVTSLINEADAALAAAPRDLAPGLRETSKTMQTFLPVVEEMRTRSAAISQLVTALSDIATAVGDDDERLARLVASLRSAMGALDTRSAELDSALGELPGFTSELQAGLDDTAELANELDPTLQALSASAGDLPPALARLRGTVRSIDQLVDAADPVVRLAQPVLADLAPFMPHARSAASDLTGLSADLPSATGAIVPWMDDLAAFVYQTSSAFSVSDVNGGLGRADLRLDLNNPTGGLGGDPSYDGETSGARR